MNGFPAHNARRVASAHGALLLLVSFLLVVFAGCGKRGSLELRDYKTQSEEARALLAGGHAEKALAIARNLLAQPPDPGQDSVRAEAALLAALCEERLGGYDQALRDFRSSMEHTREAMDQRLERVNKLALGRYYAAAGEDQVARRLAHEAAAGARVFADTALLTEALALSAVSDGRSGETDRALGTIAELERALHGPSTGLQRMRFDALLASGRSVETRALLAAWRLAAGGDRHAAMTAAYCGGLFQESLGHPDSALASYATALSLLDAAVDSAFARELFASLGTVAYELRRYADARRYFSDARARAAASGDRFAEPMYALALAASDWRSTADRSAADDAAKRCTAILEASRAAGHLRAVALAEFLRGAIAEQRSAGPEALDAYRAARDAAAFLPVVLPGAVAAERLVGAIIGGEQLDWTTGPARVSAALGDASGALEENERAILADIGSFFTRSSLHPSNDAARGLLDTLRWRRRLASRCVRDVEQELAAGSSRDGERMNALVTAMGSLEASARRSASDFAASAGDLRWIVAGSALGAAALRDALPDSSALLSYVLGPRRSYVIVARRDTILVRAVDADGRYVAGLADEYVRLLGDTRVNPDGTPALPAPLVRRTRDLSAILGGILVEPAFGAMRGSGTVYVVPPVELGAVPFHALRGAGTDGPFGGSKMVKYLPAGSLLLCAAVPERPVRTVAGFGYAGGTGWDVEYELRDIRSFYDKAVVVGDTAATLSRLARTEADAVHVAGDFSLDRATPDRSSVALSSGPPTYAPTRVPLAALVALPPTPTLIVANLAAATGGLTRYAPALFLATGNRTVILGMWRGDRRAKRAFGEVLYTNLSTGIGTLDAFRSAQTSMMRRGEFGAEQRWAFYAWYGR